MSEDREEEKPLARRIFKIDSSRVNRQMEGEERGTGGGEEEGVVDE